MYTHRANPSAGMEDTFARHKAAIRRGVRLEVAAAKTFTVFLRN